MLQKHIKNLVVIALLSTSLTVISEGFAYAETYGRVTVTADILNLRASPNTSSKIIGNLKKGSQLKVLQNSGKWHKVSLDGLNGWVSVKYVNSANTINEAKSATENNTYMNTDKNINKNEDANKDINKSDNTYISDNNTTNTMTEAVAVKYGKITGNNVNVRKGPGLSYSVIKQLNKGELLEILDKTEKWYQVKLSDNVLGWVSSSYISEFNETIEETNDKNDNQKENQSANSFGNDSGNDSGEGSGKEADISQSSSAGKQGSQTGSSDTKNTDYETPASQISEESTVVISELIDFAQSLVGVKYMYGGTSPETGFDCSGFIQYVFGSFGIKLERVAADQAKQGVEVKQEDLLPGDLVFSDTDGGNNNINHVGIYIGDGKFIHAASGSSSAKVTVTNMESSYWKSTYMTARRIV